MSGGGVPVLEAAAVQLPHMDGRVAPTAHHTPTNCWHLTTPLAALRMGLMPASNGKGRREEIRGAQSGPASRDRSTTHLW